MNNKTLLIHWPYGAVGPDLHGHWVRVARGAIYVSPNGELRVYSTQKLPSVKLGYDPNLKFEGKVVPK